MFKFIVAVLLFFTVAALYEQNQISLMNDDQKQAILTQQETDKKKRDESEKIQALVAEKQSKEMEELSNTPWAKIEKDQYIEKVIADQHYLWLLSFLLPVVFLKLLRSLDRAKNGR